MEAHVEIVRETMVEVQTELKSMNETLSENTRQLEVHIEGVRLAREQNTLLRLEVNERLAPIEEISNFVSSCSKLVIGMIALPPFIYYVIQIIHSLKS